MRALILTGSPAYARASLQLFAEQIVAGPDWPDAQTRDGYWLSLRTPVGEYNLAELLAKIPSYQRPEIVICLADAQWRNRPTNLRAFRGMKILMLSDRAGDEPAMSDLFPYVSAESFDRVMFRQDEVQLLRLLAPLSGQPFSIAAGFHAPVDRNPAHARAS